MKAFTSVKDVANPEVLLQLAKQIKDKPFEYQKWGQHKTIGLLFFNPSLRTRMSTQKAAQNLGMNVMIMNLNKDSWQLELEDGTIMDKGSQEHIKEATAVVSQYCDIIGVRTFAQLKDPKEDYSEHIINKFIAHAEVPIVSLESATLHPLQSLADWLTIEEQKKTPKPKVVLSWAPHPKALPQAVANSFLEWMKVTDYELAIACPKGMELAEEYMNGVEVFHDQESAFKNADFIYTKNWSSYKDYGQVNVNHNDWMIDSTQLQHSNDAKFMHCLPVRRNVVVSDQVLDSKASIVIEQANNRTYAAQAVLLKLLGYEG